MSKRPMIIAHRGASAEAPENTLAAFKLGMEQGAEGVEFDIHLTADNRLRVIHDHSLERTTNLSGFVTEKTMQELQQADAGSWKSTAYAGEHVPELSDVLSLFPEGAFINIEIKNGPLYYAGIAEILCKEVKPWRGKRDILISSFDHQVLSEVHRADASLKLGILYEADLYNPLDYIRRLPFPVFSCNVWHHFVTRAFVEEMHGSGIAVYPYTVDKQEDVERMVRAGADGIITNVPGELSRSKGAKRM